VRLETARVQEELSLSQLRRRELLRVGVVGDQENSSAGLYGFVTASNASLLSSSHFLE
jgi:hypothetical protein